MVRVVLVAPEIPPNTGNVARTCAATGTPLHLVDPLGFQLTDRYLKRAGLDYWPAVDLHRHASWEALQTSVAGASGAEDGGTSQSGGRFWCFTVRGKTCYTDIDYAPDDWLVFGCESRGLPPEILAQHPTAYLPMTGPVRSLNLGSSVAIALFEALRQLRSSSASAGSS